MDLDINPTKPTKCVRLIRSPTYRELTVYINIIIATNITARSAAIHHVTFSEFSDCMTHTRTF